MPQKKKPQPQPGPKRVGWGVAPDGMREVAHVNWQALREALTAALDNGSLATDLTSAGRPTEQTEAHLKGLRVLLEQYPEVTESIFDSGFMQAMAMAAHAVVSRAVDGANPCPVHGPGPCPPDPSALPEVDRGGRVGRA